jgi:hypothetical protein
MMNLALVAAIRRTPMLLCPCTGAVQQRRTAYGKSGLCAARSHLLTVYVGERKHDLKTARGKIDWMMHSALFVEMLRGER